MNADTEHAASHLLQDEQQPWNTMAFYGTTEKVGVIVAERSQAWYFTNAIHRNTLPSFGFSATNSSEMKPRIKKMQASLHQQTPVSSHFPLTEWPGEAVMHPGSPFMSQAFILFHTYLSLQGFLTISHCLPQNPSVPQSIYNALKIIPENHNLEKIGPYRNYLIVSFNLLYSQICRKHKKI